MASRLGPSHGAILAALEATADGRSLRSALGVNYDAIVVALDWPERSLGGELQRWHSTVSEVPTTVDVLSVEVPLVPSDWSTSTLTPGRLIVVVGPTSVVPDQSGPWQEVFVIGARSAGYWVDRDNHFVVDDGRGVDALRRPPVSHAIARWLGLPPLQSVENVGLGDQSDPPKETPSGPVDQRRVRTRAAPPSPSGSTTATPTSGQPTVGAPPGPVSQYMMAQTVSALAPRTEAAVTVTVSGSELRSSSSNVGMADFRADPSRRLTVFARSKGPVEIVEAWRHELAVQAAGASTRCQFIVRAVSPGVGSVVLSAFQGSDDLATIELPITVQADTSTIDRQGVQTQSAQITASGPPRVRNQLRVYKDGPDGYTCELMMPSAGLDMRRSIRPQGGTPERLRAILESLGGLSALSLSHGPALDDHLLGLGRRIQNWFLPPEFVTHLWEQRAKIDRLEVLSDEPHLPWELCAVASPHGDVAEALPFLGERGVTRRWPNVVGVRSLAVRRDRRFLVAPSYPDTPGRFLPRGASEAEFVETRYGAQRISADLASMSELIRGGDYDLLHFVGHGWSSFGPIDDATLLLDDSEFVAERTPTGFTSQMVRRSDRHPVVFLNGCETGRISTCIGGFAVAFMEAGAGLFIGTQWEVEDGPAREFAEALYGCLFDQALTLSEAITTVRARRGPVWTATPLAYVAYGDPDAKVVAD